jgi:hypothetical protein
VAFFEHQWRFDDRGSVKVVDRSGTVTTLTGELWGLQGLAWTPDGATVVFSGNAEGGFVLGPMSVPAAGDAEARPVFGVPGRFIVHDIGRQGEWLAVREDLALGVRVRVAGDASERELSWLGSAGARALSADGQWLLMVDVGRRGGRDYGVVLRRTDASRTIRLGAGFSQALSPDGTRAAAIVAAPPQLFVYPTGPGEPTRVDTGSLERIVSADGFRTATGSSSVAPRPDRRRGVSKRPFPAPASDPSPARASWRRWRPMAARCSSRGRTGRFTSPRSRAGRTCPSRAWDRAIARSPGAATAAPCTSSRGSQCRRRWSASTSPRERA